MEPMWWLIVVIKLNGVWVLGKDMEDGGWSPRAYASQVECEERRDFAQKNFEKLKLRIKTRETRWTCKNAVGPNDE
jgi:hypothetical protein